ncbi:MAG TPA: thioesterase family protein [Ktedonobacteraceae bacterium]
MNVWYPVQIRFRDLDPLAHVNNSVFFVYFEEARSYYFDQLNLERWPSQETDQLIHSSSAEEKKTHTSRIQTTSIGAHYGSLIKENSCTYNLPIIRSDKAEIGVQVVRVGYSSFVMDLQIRDSGEHERVFATGRTVMVWCNYHTGRPFPVPSVLRAAFERIEKWPSM